MSKSFLLVLALFIPRTVAHAQYFEGDVVYNSYYLDVESGVALFEPIRETVSIKGPHYRIKIDSATNGALDWFIADYSTNAAYSQKAPHDASLPVYKNGPVMKDGKLVSFGEPDTSRAEPIFKGVVCTGKSSSSLRVEFFDTTVLINGIRSKVAQMKRNDKLVADYYYSDSLLLDPVQYGCYRVDALDLLYRRTKGGIITQIVQYDAPYFTYVYQLVAVRPRIIPDRLFDIPRGISIIDRK